MKKILITGANSYIGTSFEAYMGQWSGQYRMDTLDMKDAAWQDWDFSGYDCVFHVAGIAHVKETAKNRDLYYRVNRDLAFRTAKKAKEAGVKQFVFLSTMAVYGAAEGAIGAETPTEPVNHYGKAKLEAEGLIGALAGGDFKVMILRPPMVYGEGCKGNYRLLVKFAKVMPVFPDYENRRSVLHIDRLCAWVKEAIDAGSSGLAFPQDEAYACTCRMVRDIAAGMGRRVRLLKLLNPAVWAAKLLPIGRKAFGDLYYEKEM